MNEIYVGGTYDDGVVTGYRYHFTEEPVDDVTIKALKSERMSTALSLIGDQLSIDELTVTLAYANPNEMESRATRSVVQSFVIIPNEPVYYFYNEELMGKFYAESVKRINRDDYRLVCVSGIGLLDRKQHLGGMYGGTLTGDTCGTVIASIMDDGTGSPIVPYTIDNAVANTAVYEWLPVASKRENLQAVLFSYAISLIKNADGSIRFTFLDDTEVKELPIIFENGTVDEEPSDRANKIELTEHIFRALDTDQDVTLFDNTDGASGVANNALCIFQSAPCHTLTATSGLTIVESGANYAILSGTGVLKGKTYTHTTQVRTLSTDDINVEDERVQTFSEPTLISPINSENVINRLLAYYSGKKEVSIDVDISDQKCGDQVRFVNPYGKTDAGYITALDITASTFLRAKAQIVTNYNAQGFGNYYSHAEVLTGEGYFDFPIESAERCRIVMIGGGNGGNGGYDGTDGTDGTNDEGFGTGGSGGDAGTGGDGGNIYTFDLDVRPGTTSFEYQCGVGGSGGAKNGGIGEAGTDTTLQLNGEVYTTADGSPVTLGVSDLINGGVYGAKGRNGVQGGDGGSGTDNGASATAQNVSWPGGRGGLTANNYFELPYYGGLYYLRIWSEAYGGGGGGASFGNAGQDTQAIAANASNRTGERATGGKGADAVASDPATLGSGGAGGSGGGGGGAGGYTVRTEYDSYTRKTTLTTTGRAGGAKGLGSAGMPGGDGVIIVYY